MPVITYRQALRDTLRAEMHRDENVFLMGEEIGVFEAPTRSLKASSKSSGSGASATPPSPRRGSSVQPSAQPCSACARSSKS